MFKTITAPLRALRRNERWIAAFFFCSGISALVYQVAWQRLLVLQSGVGIYSISVIVAAFLAGLGIGNITGGRWSLRLTPSGAMRAFSLVEICIGLFALISPLLYYQGFQHLPTMVYGNRLFTGIAHFSALLPPTLLMGMSFPLLVRAICREDWVSSTGIAGLYGLNTVGAALGAILTPWLLMRYWGIDGAIYIASVINIVVGLASLYMRPLLAEGNPEELHATDDPNPPHLPWFWLLLYAASGCVGVGLEILWFRVLDTALKSTAFTFGTLLGWYLLCLGAGCVAGGAVARRSSNPLRTFLLCQTGAVAYALTAFLGFVWMPPSFPLYNDVYLYWQQMQSVTALEAGNVRIFLLLYVVMPLMFFGPVTFLQGLSFASLQRAVQSDPRHAGHRVGLLQAANIAGCVAGSLGVGLLGLQYVGTMGSLRLLAVFGFLFCLVGILRARLRRSGLALLALLTFAVVFLPSNNSFWTRLHGQTIQDSIIGEDSTGLIALVPTHRGMGIRYKDVRIGGKFHSWLPYSNIHSMFGAVPSLVHSNALEVAVIGLASGETAHAFGSRPGIRKVRIYEICEPQLAVLREYERQTGYVPVERVLDSQRFELVFADGRHALEGATNRYDIITADVPPPTDAYSSLLFSVEFFKLMRSRLKPGGIVCSWTPTDQVRASFLSAFPHSLGFTRVNGNPLLPDFMLGADAPIPIDVLLWNTRLAETGTQAYLGRDVAREVATILPSARVFDKAAGALITDLFPRNEFAPVEK